MNKQTHTPAVKPQKGAFNIWIFVLAMLMVIASIIAIQGTSGSFTSDNKFDFGGTSANTLSGSFTQRFISGTQPVSFYDSGSYVGRFGILGDNEVPQITRVVVQGPVDLNEGPSATNVSINFTIVDEDGAAYLNSSSATVTIDKTDESTRRSIVCSEVEASGTEANYSCLVEVWWFDGAGIWYVNVSMADNSSSTATNNTQSLTMNSLISFVQSPGNLTFGELSAGTSNETANEVVLLNNTGNYDFGNSNISVNVTHLIGEDDPTQGIYSRNISVGTTTGSNAECAIGSGGTATQMNTTALYATVAGASLSHGNFTINDGTAQEQLYVCIQTIGSELSAQSYSTGENGPWIIQAV